MSYHTQPPTQEQINAVRGNFFVKPEPPYPEPVKRPLRELKAAEQEVIARRRAAVYQHMQDMLPFFKDMHEAGMIDGWRGVGDVVLLNEGEEHGTD